MTDSKKEFVTYGKQGSVTENADLRVYNFLTNKLVNIENSNLYPAWKGSKYGVFSGSYFPLFGLNTDSDYPSE